MKSQIFFFLAMIALGSTQDECNETRVEERVFDCLGDVSDTLFAGEPSAEEVCENLQTLKSCLDVIIDECHSEERAEVEKEMQELTDILANCPNKDDIDAAESCAEDNEDYFKECFSFNRYLPALAQLANNDPKFDMNRLKCTSFSMIADCITGRIEEKCSKIVSDIMREEFSDPPEEIKEACDAADASVGQFNLLYW